MTNRKLVAALSVVAALALASAEEAAAQGSRGAGFRPVFLNPFGNFATASRVGVNPFGVVSASSLTATPPVSLGSSSGGTTVTASSTRVPYVPPVRSPFRPPPRPSFGTN